MKRIFSLIIAVFLVQGLLAQNSVSFYNLGNATFQNSYLNPALYPQGRVFFGLPGLSGVHINLNSPLSYDQMITDQVVDGDKLVENTSEHNKIGVKVNLELLHLGFRLNSGLVFSLSARERVSADLTFGKSLAVFYRDGNYNSLDKSIPIGLGVKGSHFRELALGVAVEKFEKLTVGARFKYLVGMFNAQTNSSLDLSLLTKSRAFETSVIMKNIDFNSSGLDILQSKNTDSLISHVIFNGNTGFAVDLGATYQLMPELKLSASILDLGGISWSENAQRQQVNDQEVSLNLKLSKNLDFGAVADSLKKKVLPDTTNVPSYSSPLATRAFVSASSNYFKHFELSATIGSKFEKGNSGMIYALGIGRSFINNRVKLSASVVKTPQQPVSLGAALSAGVGSTHFYLAADNITNFNVPKMKGIDLRLGINFIFGWNSLRRKEARKLEEEDDTKDIGTYSGG